jgi:hypothetical protein
MPEVINLRKIARRNFADPVRAVVEAEVDGLTLRGLKLEWHGPNHWRLVPPGRRIQHQWQIIYDFSTRSVYDCLLKKVVQAYDEGPGASEDSPAKLHQDPIQCDDSIDEDYLNSTKQGSWPKRSGSRRSRSKNDYSRQQAQVRNYQQ